MSPFSQYLFDLRMRLDIRQAELAERVGCDQSYISAIEVGIKGPPTQEFLEALANALHFSEKERQDAQLIAAASHRKIVLEPDCPTDVYWMLSELRQKVEMLRPAQIKLIREVLSQTDGFTEQRPQPVRRLKRRQKSEAPM